MKETNNKRRLNEERRNQFGQSASEDHNNRETFLALIGAIYKMYDMLDAAARSAKTTKSSGPVEYRLELAGVQRDLVHFHLLNAFDCVKRDIEKIAYQKK